METALISTEHLWYTVALGNCFHIDAESEPLWGYSANSCTVGHLLHGNAHGNKWEKRRVYRREVYPPFTMTLITRKSISPRAMRRPSHVYGPSSVFFMPRIWRWLLLSSLNRTKEARGVKVERGWLNTWTIQGHGHVQGYNLRRKLLYHLWTTKMYFCALGSSNSTSARTTGMKARQKAKLSSSSKLNMALVWILKEKGAILIMKWFKIIRPTHELVLLFSCGAEPADPLVWWYCSVSGVDNKLYIPIQNQINFCFQSPGGKRGPGRKAPSSEKRFRIVAAGGTLYFKD